MVQHCTAGKYNTFPLFLFHFTLHPGRSVSKQSIHPENGLTKYELTVVICAAAEDIFHEASSASEGAYFSPVIAEGPGGTLDEHGTGKDLKFDGG